MIQTAAGQTLALEERSPTLQGNDLDPIWIECRRRTSLEMMRNLFGFSPARREPSGRCAPDGQLRPALKPEPAGTALRAHSPFGQTEVCHLWNLCAANTREGEICRRLPEKLEEARAALGGKVYDVLGELFEGHALRDLLVDAIRYGDRPETKAELFRKVDGAVDVGAIENLVAERKLKSEGMNSNSVATIREQIERAQARRFQSHSVSAFFRKALTMLGGRISEREKGRYEITRVPGISKERDRLIKRSDPVLDRYSRITFEKSLIVGQPRAELTAPGHPLLEPLVDAVLEGFQPLLSQGGVLVDETDAGEEPRLLVFLEHAVRDARSGRSGETRAISQRLQFIFSKEDGSATDGGPAPYLDFRPITADERWVVAEAIAAPWLSGNVEAKALGYAVARLLYENLTEVRTRRIAEIDKVERDVRARLTGRSTIGMLALPGCGKRSAPARSSVSTPRTPSSTASARSRPCRRSSGARPS